MAEIAASVAIFDERGRILLVLEREAWSPSPRSRALETLPDVLAPSS